ncbi:type VI secretion system baseplate subunit TssF [Pseudoduganella umbonata]|nr:type VI secretion system baseplate subunit TssF [Pseudoduganella umbonata]MBB3225239.1 type VI secretion system protein ImpG [Pseudoduganella umbonata]
MDKLLPYFEREMGILRRNFKELISRNPALASTLGVSAGQGVDPVTERVMQGTALLCAKNAWNLDYYHTRLTNDLLAILSPFYLNPVPSCSVAHFDAGTQRVSATIPRGTEFHFKSEPACRFRTVYDVTIPALALTASYTARVDAPLSLGLPPSAGGAIRIVIESTDPAISLDKAIAEPVRVFIDTDAATRTALYEGLFARTLCTCVESEQQWWKLKISPLTPVGLSRSEALLPTPRRQEDSLRLLAEYFAFPEKFDFFDIDLKSVLAESPKGAQRVVLHMIVPDLHQTSTPQLLRALPATALRLGCTPVVNMFSNASEAIRITEGQDVYPLIARRSNDAEIAIYSIDSIKLLCAVDGGNAAVDLEWAGEQCVAPTKRWTFKRANPTLGTEDTVSFLDDRRKPLLLAEGTATAQLTCTNGSLPATLPVGRAGGDLVGDEVAAACTIRLLCTPTAPLVLADKPDDHFEVLGAGSAGGRALTQFDLPSLLELLRLHARPDCAVTERQLAGIVAVDRSEIKGALRHEYGSSLAYGYQIRLTVDEAAFTHRSIYSLAQVMDYVFGYYIAWGNFSRLIVQTVDGRELVRCAQRPGSQSPA